VTYRVQLTSEARRQLLEIDEWWRGTGEVRRSEFFESLLA
jgi:hypothetical protein